MGDQNFFHIPVNLCFHDGKFFPKFVKENITLGRDLFTQPSGGEKFPPRIENLLWNIQKVWRTFCSFFELFFKRIPHSNSKFLGIRLSLKNSRKSPEAQILWKILSPPIYLLACFDTYTVDGHQLKFSSQFLSKQSQEIPKNSSIQFLYEIPDSIISCYQKNLAWK